VRQHGAAREVDDACGRQADGGAEFAAQHAAAEGHEVDRLRSLQVRQLGVMRFGQQIENRHSRLPKTELLTAFLQLSFDRGR